MINKLVFIALMLVSIASSCDLKPTPIYELYIYSDGSGTNQLFIDDKAIEDYKDYLYVPMETFQQYYVLDGRINKGTLEIRSPDGSIKYRAQLVPGASIINLTETHQVGYRESNVKEKDSQDGRLGAHYIHGSEPSGKSRHLMAIAFNLREYELKGKRDFYQKNRVIELFATPIKR